ncbi:MAG: bifunctional (p)ppGpp synthetase/guanosine-3',5'-bis(diphosphate) 3'-pyrophosphohydrolase, partial [Burkholderiales bacterium]|nr:bifunctional (p)ppGpp synthetase/guanosine-3',5'-bis(diphosphate) 3'-pyrophosphohydrolase [Burkholderiales bacterium]
MNASDAPLQASAPAGAPATIAERARALARATYAASRLGTGEDTYAHAAAIAAQVDGLQLGADAVAAGWLFALPHHDPAWREHVLAAFGHDVAALLDGLARLHKLRDITRDAADGAAAGQVETLRKMLLAMVSDVRVVLLRLASRLQTLRWVAADPAHPQRESLGRETLEFYAPLANRLGVWQLKWELEDLAFRLTEPETYRRIAGLIAARRAERETYIRQAIDTLAAELARAGIAADVIGRPKHIFSIWSKMRAKSLEFDDLYDVRALRVLVDDVKDCYAALGVVHNLWQPIPREFDDYISRPKGNNYRSLHTAVIGPDDLAIEVQIRSREMHRHAELGVAAHWRYKEAGVQDAAQSVRSTGSFDAKLAYLRQLLSWRDDLASGAGAETGPARDWRSATLKARLDDTVYVLTPQGRVIDLPQGATPVDFAYHLHSDLGHRCRGARVDGTMVPLNTPLATGQRVEIIAAKTGGPSRDWLNPAQGYLASNRARTKVRQWFSAQDLAETTASGRAIVERELQRLGRTGSNLEQLAARLGFSATDDLFVAAARGEWSLRNIAAAFETESREPPQDAAPVARRSRIEDSPSRGVLVVGVDRLLTQLARCCKPAPPDPIRGFVARGKGVSIHRLDCSNFRHLWARNPERVVESRWGDTQDS